MSKMISPVAALVLTLLLSSCDSPDEPMTVQEPAQPATPPPVIVETPQPLGPTNPALVQLAQQQGVQASLASIALNNAVKQLLASPTSEQLAATRRAWEQAIEHVEALHIFTHLRTLPSAVLSQVKERQFSLSAWPVEPGYLDAYGEHAYSGLVFDIGLPLTAQTLREQHGLTANADASLGLYAMEFLLFGETGKRAASALAAVPEVSAKQREQGYQAPAELPRNRRRQMLELQAQLLVEDANHLEQWWAEHKPAVSDNDLLQAAEAMATGQIIDVAQLQKAQELERERISRTLARRLSAQLNGWQQALAEVAHPQKAELLARTQKAIEQLQPLLPAGAPASTDLAEAQAPSSQWKNVYRSLRKLVAHLGKQELPKPLPEDPREAEAPDAEI